MATAYVNGRYMDLHEACVPVEDRGFQFGDGVYETVRIYSGRAFSLDRHLDRFEESARALEIPPPSRSEVEAILGELLARDGVQEGQFYIQLTRGRAPRAHGFPKEGQPTLVAYVQPVELPDPRLYQEGASAIVVPDLRWGLCHIKSTNLLANVLAKEKAHRAGAFEALQEREGFGITEGSSSNVFAVLDGVLRTAPEGPWILGGITREWVLRLAREQGIAVEERPFDRHQLERASEVFVTGTTTEIMPITRVDGRPVGDGRVGPVTRALMQAYSRLIADFRSS